MNNKVSIGATTIVGWTTAFLTLLPTVIKAVEEGQVAFNGPEKYLAIFGIASGLVTNVARYLQAHKLISTTVENAIVSEEPSTNAAELEVEKETPVLADQSKLSTQFPVTSPTSSA